MRDFPAKPDLSRLLRPRSVALMGGAWAANVAVQLQKAGFDGPIWPVHPTRESVADLPCLRSLADLPEAPDATFVGVNREATVEAVTALAAMGAGGAVCFAAGFREAGDAALEDRLVAAAGTMPVIGPNCYGLLNALDGVALWPDQHGLMPVASGVAIVGQSSNVAINLTMQRRGLPIAFVLMAGNQAQTDLAALAGAALADPRVTALGLHVEGFGDLRAWEIMTREAHRLGKPVVVLKAGRSDAARAAALTHTASLAGGAAVASAFLQRTGCVEVRTLGAFLETLKLLHHCGPLPGPKVASVSCSGGEASLMADGAEGTAIRWAPFDDGTRAALADALGPRVGIANPLDYNTFIWGDVPSMTETFAAVLRGGFDLTAFVLDLPRADRCSPEGHRCAVEAILAARALTGARAAVLASLPETLDEAATAEFEAGGVVVLHGMADGLSAIDAGIRAGRARAADAPALLGPPGRRPPARMVPEDEAKRRLAAYGLPIPASVTAPNPAGIAAASRGLRHPVALKALGLAHKTEAGAVALHLADEAAVRAAADRIAATTGAALLAEEMAPAGVEILVGAHRDDTGLHALLLGAGGVLAEVIGDTATLVLPAPREAVRETLMGLRVGRLLAGHRGAPPADLEAILDAVEAIARFAEAEAHRLEALDVNPLICGPAGVVAVDALIWEADA